MRSRSSVRPATLQEVTFGSSDGSVGKRAAEVPRRRPCAGPAASSTTPTTASRWWSVLKSPSDGLTGVSFLKGACRKHMAVAQINVPKWHLGKWNQRLKPAVCPSCLILSHSHLLKWSSQNTSGPGTQGANMQGDFSKGKPTILEIPLPWLTLKGSKNLNFSS